MASLLAESPQQSKHRNLYSCDNCRKEKKKCKFLLPWNDEEQNPPCDRCDRKDRTCGGPVYIPRKSKSAANTTIIAVGERLGVEDKLPEARVEEQREQEPASTQPPAVRHRALQAWGPAGAPCSEDEVTDRKEIVKELGDILASIEVLRLYLYICEDNRSWCTETIVNSVQADLTFIKTALEAEFFRLAQHSYADEEMKELYDSDLRSLIGRFENPPQRPERATFGNATSQNSSSFFAQVRNESFTKRRRDGVYSVADHLCHDVCTTMSSGNVSCYSLDLQRLLPIAARAIAKVIGKVQLPCGDSFVLPISNSVHTGSTLLSTQPFPLAHLTLLQTDDHILRHYAQKDADLKAFFDIDLIGGTVSHLAAHLGRTSNLDLAFHDHTDKRIISQIKRDVFGLLPHMIAGCRNNVEALKFCVKHGANLNAVDKNNETCLDFATQTGSTDVVDWLLQNGYGWCSYKNPIFRAVEHMQFAVLDVFITHYTVYEHHNYQDINDAADLAESWAIPGSIEEERLRYFATALRELETNRPSYRSLVLGNLASVGHRDTIDTSFLISTPSQSTPHAYAGSQVTYGTPFPDLLDPFTPQAYGPHGSSHQTGYG